ncbi:MAG: SRPBCC family protein [Aestuariivirga sp.]
MQFESTSPREKREVSQQISEAMTYMDKTLQPEDIPLCESVQKGLKSKGHNQGRFVIDPAHPQLSEHGVHHFQKLVAQAVKMAPQGWSYRN